MNPVMYNTRQTNAQKKCEPRRQHCHELTSINNAIDARWCSSTKFSVGSIEFHKANVMRCDRDSQQKYKVAQKNPFELVSFRLLFFLSWRRHKSHRHAAATNRLAHRRLHDDGHRMNGSRQRPSSKGETYSRQTDANRRIPSWATCQQMLCARSHARWIACCFWCLRVHVVCGWVIQHTTIFWLCRNAEYLHERRNYSICANLPNDPSLLALEQMQKSDEEFGHALEKNPFTRSVIHKYIVQKKPLTEKERADPLIGVILDYAGAMAKQRARFCIVQEERMRKYFEWIREEERSSVARKVRFETQKSLTTMKGHEIACNDETIAVLAQRLQYYRCNPMNPRARHVIKDE